MNSPIKLILKFKGFYLLLKLSNWIFYLKVFTLCIFKNEMKKIKLITFGFSLVLLTYILSYNFLKYHFKNEFNQCLNSVEEITDTNSYKLHSNVILQGEDNNLFLQIDNFSNCFTIQSISYEVIGIKNSKIDSIRFKFYEDVLPNQTLKTLISEISLDSIIKFNFKLSKVKF